MRLPVLRKGLCALLTAGFMVATAYAEYMVPAKVEADSLRLRAEPSTGAEILTQASNGKIVAVLDKEKLVNDSGEWYKVTYKDKEGYMSADYLSFSDEYIMGYGVINEDVVNLRSEPNTECEVVKKLVKGAVLEVYSKDGDWYSVMHKDSKGFIRQDLLDFSDEKPQVTTSVVSTATASGSSNAAGDRETGVKALDATEASSLQKSIVEKAMTYMGLPYKYGASGPKSFDCSGFTSYVYKQMGYSISRTASSQYTQNGTKVKKADLMPGDLVFFKDSRQGKTLVTHTGIYVGQGNFIHASSGSGKCVKINTLNSGYYSTYYYGAKRIV